MSTPELMNPTARQKSNRRQAGPNSTWCHHCHSSSNLILHCTVCRIGFCVLCLRNRYKTIPDPNPDSFVCPRCERRCECNECTPRDTGVFYFQITHVYLYSHIGAELKNLGLISGAPPAGKGTSCHHCRSKQHSFLSCQKGGCKLRYCTRCLESRYGTTLEAEKSPFTCFRCRQACRCDKCPPKFKTALNSNSPLSWFYLLHIAGALINKGSFTMWCSFRAQTQPGSNTRTIRPEGDIG
jgi:hypothetical protein